MSHQAIKEHVGKLGCISVSEESQSEKVTQYDSKSVTL